jgi:hypothetical protein
MNEGPSKAIPLTRARTPGAQAAASRVRRWREAVDRNLRAVAAPPRQIWLATLGGTALTVRAVHTLWTRIVAEGEAAERWLRGAPPGR